MPLVLLCRHRVENCPQVMLQPFKRLNTSLHTAPARHRWHNELPAAPRSFPGPSLTLLLPVRVEQNS